MLQILKDLFISKAEQASEIKGFHNNYDWLSNFYIIEPFIYDEIEFNTTENFYQAMKTKDKEIRKYIATLKPGQAKRYVNPDINKNFVVREDWEKIKLSVMEYAIRIKFSQQDFKDLLLATRNIYIEETNSWNDIFWGCNTAGEGQNHLGKLYMKIREELKNNIDLLSNFKINENIIHIKKQKPLP